MAVNFIILLGLITSVASIGCPVLQLMFGKSQNMFNHKSQPPEDPFIRRNVDVVIKQGETRWINKNEGYLRCKVSCIESCEYTTVPSFYFVDYYTKTTDLGMRGGYGIYTKKGTVFVLCY